MIIEICLNKWIDNFIRSKDRSLKYSHQKKDSTNAIQIEKFENFVLSEEKKKEIKIIMLDILKSKIEYLNNLIEGYDRLDELYVVLLILMIKSIDVDDLI